MTQYTPFTHNFLQSILSSIDSKDPVVANAWLDTLLDVIDLLPEDVLSNEVLTIAVNKANTAQPTFSRLGSCQLVGKLGLKLNKEIIQSSIIPLAQSLSQDVEWSIRASICTQLSLIAKGLTNGGKELEDEFAIQPLLLILVELSNDELEAVRMVTIEAALSLIPFLCGESIAVVIIPLMRRMSEQAIKLEDKTLPQLAQNWARISRNLSAHLNNQDKEWFTHFYYCLTSLGTNHQHQTIQDKPHVIWTTIIGLRSILK